MERNQETGIKEQREALFIVKWRCIHVTKQVEIDLWLWEFLIIFYYIHSSPKAQEHNFKYKTPSFECRSDNIHSMATLLGAPV